MMEQLLVSLMPELRLRSKVKRTKIINSFEEVSIRPGLVIE